MRGRRRRVAATVSMDQLVLQLEPGDEDVAVGDEVTLRRRATATSGCGWRSWPRLIGTLGYELATRLAPRPQRVAREVRD